MDLIVKCLQNINEYKRIFQLLGLHVPDFWLAIVDQEDNDSGFPKCYDDDSDITGAWVSSCLEKMGSRWSSFRSKDSEILASKKDLHRNAEFS